MGILKDNKRFIEMQVVYAVYETARIDHDAMKRVIVQRSGYDSDEYRQWDRENDEFIKNRPYTDGEFKALSAWMRSVNKGYNDLVIDDFFWKREAIEDFIETLRNAGITEFITTDNSTGLMENIHWFMEFGCEIVESCEIPYNDGFDGSKLGLRFRINNRMLIDKATKDLEQQKTGHWVKIAPYPMQTHEYACSECGHETHDNTENYCSDCGARMQEVEDK